MHLRKPGKWAFQGACRSNPELFYPEKRVMVGRAGTDDPEDLIEDSVDDYSAEAVAEAKTICQTCPVLATCREYALEHEPEHGVWAAMTPDERRKVVLQRALEA